MRIILALFILTPFVTLARPALSPEVTKNLTVDQNYDMTGSTSQNSNRKRVELQLNEKQKSHQDVLPMQNSFEINSVSGGSCTGGGNICYLEKNPVLLELSEFDSKFNSEPGVRTRMFDNYYFSLMPFSPLFRLSDERYRDYVYFNSIKERVDKILAANLKASPVVIGILRYITSHFYFSFVNYPIEVSVLASFSGQKKCTPENTKASILFVPPMKGFIDINQFQKLDLNSQAGLIIHESFRVLQYLLSDKLHDKRTAEKIMNNSRMQDLVQQIFQNYFGQNIETSKSDIDSKELIKVLAKITNVQVYEQERIKNETIQILSQYEAQEEEIKISFLNAVPDFPLLFKLISTLKESPEAVSISQKEMINGYLKARCLAVENMREVFKYGLLAEALSARNFESLMGKNNEKCSGDLIPELIRKFDQHIKDLNEYPEMLHRS